MPIPLTITKRKAASQTGVPVPGTWQITFDIASPKDEGECHRASRILEYLKFLLFHDPAFRTFAHTLAATESPRALSIKTRDFVRGRLRQSYPAVEAIAFCTVIPLVAENARHARFSALAHPAEPIIRHIPKGLVEQFTPREGETLSQCKRRVRAAYKRLAQHAKASLGSPIPKGRKPKNHGPEQGLPRYVRWWYQKKWIGESHHLMGIENSSRRRAQIAAIDQLLQRVIPRDVTVPLP